MVLYIFVRWTRYISIYYERIFSFETSFYLVGPLSPPLWIWGSFTICFRLDNQRHFMSVTPYYAYKFVWEAEQKKNVGKLR